MVRPWVADGGDGSWEYI